MNRDPKTTARKAMALLETLSCPPTPRAYAVAYACAEDPDGALASAVMAEAGRRGRLRAADVERLHVAHLEGGEALSSTADGLGRHLDAAMVLFGEGVARSSEAVERMRVAPDDAASSKILRDAMEAQDGLLRRLRAQSDELDALRRRYAETLEESRRDPLTGLANRRSYDERIAEALDALADGGPAVSLLVGDIDHFKAINDTHGHGVGDEVIRLIGKTVRAAIRGGDTAARLGGEEYGVVLVGADLAQASAVAERIRATVAGFRPIAAAGGGAGRKVTLSLGVAQARPGESAASVYERADAMLYEAKRSGRDRVVSAGPEPEAAPAPRGP